MHPHLAIYFGSPFGRYPTFHTLTSAGRKKNCQYAKRMFPLSRAIVKTDSYADAIEPPDAFCKPQQEIADEKRLVGKWTKPSKKTSSRNFSIHQHVYRQINEQKSCVALNLLGFLFQSFNLVLVCYV